MLKFLGRNTRGDIHYNTEGESPMDLYNVLVDEEIISTFDGDPYGMAQLEKAGIKESEFLDEDGDYDDFKYLEALENLPSLTDLEILDIIRSCDGNAYYQDIVMTQGDAAELLGVTRSRVSALARDGKLDVINGMIDAKDVYRYLAERKKAGRPSGTMKKVGE